MSDNRSQFTSREFQSDLESRGIRQRWTPVYSPGTNGLIERLNHSLKYKVEEALQDRVSIKDKLNDSLEWYRSANHSQLKISPFEYIYGIK